MTQSAESSPGSGRRWARSAAGRRSPAAASLAIRALTVVFAALCMGATWGASAQGSPLLASVFQTGAVLQREAPLRIWGEARPGERVEVRLATTTLSTSADAQGRWEVTFPPLHLGPPIDLVVVAPSATELVTDLRIGDVWLCSGQSNMEMPVRLVGNADRELRQAADTELRLLHIPHRSSSRPQSALPDGAVWRGASSESVRDFSASCYFFGREMRAATKAPIGLIAASWGGSIARAWTSRSGLAENPAYDELVALSDAEADIGAEAAWQAFDESWWRRVDPGTRADWHKTMVTSQDWLPLQRLGPWESSGEAALSDFDGVVWFRGDLELTESEARNAGRLQLGIVDDRDTTWVNGHEVGRSSGTAPRSYALPAQALTPGHNVIVVRVLDTDYGGGLLGNAGRISLATASGETVDVRIRWSYRIGPSVSELLPVPFPPSDGAKNATGLFNGMISPLAGYTSKGVAWYQGESDYPVGRGYASMLKVLINDWRRAFGQRLPFLVVQLPGFGPRTATPSRSRWAEVREAQYSVAQEDSATALVATIDLGEIANIHPSNKQDVGRRLAIAARSLQGGTAAFGPSFRQLERNADQLRIRMLVAGRARTEGSNRLLGFQLCHLERCRYVDALWDAEQAVITLDGVGIADRVRFCWDDTPVCNLVDDRGLPALPFEAPIPARGAAGASPKRR